MATSRTHYIFTISILDIEHRGLACVINVLLEEWIFSISKTVLSAQESKQNYRALDLHKLKQPNDLSVFWKKKSVKYSYYTQSESFTGMGFQLHS